MVHDHATSIRFQLDCEDRYYWLSIVQVGEGCLSQDPTTEASALRAEFSATRCLTCGLGPLLTVVSKVVSSAASRRENAACHE